MRRPTEESTAAQLWETAAHDVLQHGHRVGNTTEVIGFSHTIHHSTYCLIHNIERRVSVEYAFAELAWYLSGSNRVSLLTPYAPQYERFAEPDGTAYGAYGARGLSLGGLSSIIDELLDNSDSRQSVVSIWDHDVLPRVRQHDCPDIPCTLSLQFLLREEVLHCITTMRSNDVWLGLPYDQFCFMAIQQLIANEIGCEMGDYIHRAGSMHIYDRNLYRIQQCVKVETGTYRLEDFTMDKAIHLIDALHRQTIRPEEYLC